MLRKKVEIDGREVEFKASAAVPRIYRMKFRRDLSWICRKSQSL